MPPNEGRQYNVAIDLGELIRFLISGVISTLGNMTTVWIFHHFVSFEYSLLAGIATGFTLSFLLSKLFAFKSKQWSNAPGEIARFIVVYAISLAIYWAISVNAHSALIAYHFPLNLVDVTAVLCGAAVMTVTSYGGHRLFTYKRTARLA